MTVIRATCTRKADTYNRTLRATVPGCFVLAFEAIPAELAVQGCNVLPEFYGNTRQEAIANCVQSLRERGLSGSLKLHHA